MDTLPSKPVQDRVFCTHCGTGASASDRYCLKCGNPLRHLPLDPVHPSSASQTGHNESVDLSRALAYLRESLRHPRSFWQVVVQLGALYLLLSIISNEGWRLFAIVGGLLGFIVRPRFCEGYAGREGTFQMYLCSFRVAAQVFAGPLIISLLLFATRNLIVRRVAELAKKMWPELRYMVLPAAATCFFAISWASMHSTGSVGFVSQGSFPAVVGLLTFAVAKFDAHIQSHFRQVFARRDLVPKPLRWLLLLTVPFLLSLVITFQKFVSEPDTKEQFVVLVSLTLGYLALTPTRNARQPSGLIGQTDTGQPAVQGR